MSLTQVTLVSLVTTVLVVASGFAFVRYAYAHNDGHRFFAHSGKHCSMHGKHGRHDAEFIEHVDQHLRKELNLSESQSQALGDVIAVVRVAKSKKDGLHDQWQDKLDSPLPEKLGLLEDSMGEGLSLVQQFRPVFDTFYSSLTDEQKVKLESLAKKAHDMKH